MYQNIPPELYAAYETVMSFVCHSIPISEMDMDSVIAEDTMIYGTTADENIHGIDEFKHIMKMQAKELEGLDVRFDRNPISQLLSDDGTIGLFIEELRMSVQIDGTESVSHIRLTSLMKIIDGSWKLIHAHGSKPVASEADPWHVKEWQQEKEKLQKLVAEQTADLQKKNRELEMEAASERVRSVAMGMQKPDDIMNVLNVMKEEVDTFELGNIATWIWTKDDDGLINQWDISEVIEEGNLVNFNLRFDIYDEEKNREVHRHTKEWEKGKTYYALNWRGEKLQAMVDEVGSVDPESGKMFQEAVDVGQIKDYWHAAAPFSQGVVGLDFTSTPPEMTESILLKMSSAFDMAYQRFEDLQKAEAQAKESRIEAALERVRSRTMAMQSSNELADVGLVLFQQIEKAIGFKPESSWITFIEPDKNTMEIWVTHDDTFVKPKQVSARDHENFEREIAAWKSGEESIQITQAKEDFIQAVKKNFGMEVTDKKEHSVFHVLNVRHKYGFLGIGAWNLVSDDNIKIYQRFAKVFEQTYTRFLDLRKSEQRAYESNVEASLERVRGMAAAMNHSDDLMQIAEEMFKELKILKINPLRYGLGMIDGDKQEAELWASTVNDGHYLDMLGTISLTWHPMLLQVLDAWDAQHEEVIYELKGKELSDYYRKIGKLNPGIPNLEALQDSKTEVIQFVSFFPFKSGALYAFTDGEPGEDGRSILKRFANVFEKAHIRYNDLQTAENQARLIREERDRLEIALQELKATKDQLVQQEKLASLGQLTAGIAHEIKNPLNFVNNFSELSMELVEEARDEIKEMNSKSDMQNVELSDLLDDIEANLKTIHKHGTRADSIVKSMLQHSRGGGGEPEPADLNGLIKEYVNFAFHGMRAGKNPINVDIDLHLDASVGDVPIIADDFSRVILNLVNNAFDACAERSRSTIRDVETQNLASLPKGKKSNYKPKLTVRTTSDGKAVNVEIEDNGPGIPEEIKDKILQPFFTTKKGTAGTGLGLSITNDIIKAHGGSMSIKSRDQSTIFEIKLMK
jgi:signal transduction histidine kinase/ketosteroid isomerase-like protein